MAKKATGRAGRGSSPKRTRASSRRAPDAGAGKTVGRAKTKVQASSSRADQAKAGRPGDTAAVPRPSDQALLGLSHRGLKDLGKRLLKKANEMPLDLASGLGRTMLARAQAVRESLSPTAFRPAWLVGMSLPRRSPKKSGAESRSARADQGVVAGKGPGKKTKSTLTAKKSEAKQ